MNNQRPEWITRAAEEMTHRLGMHALAADRHGIVVEKIADIIAKHAPAQDQAIGPGDVVQVIEDARLAVVVAVQLDGRLMTSVGSGLDPRGLVRIGKAKYWPDGSLVEGGGE